MEIPIRSSYENFMFKKQLTEWTTVIKAKTGWFDIDLKELWNYKDLILLFVHRDFVTYYKQTILGPLWFLLQPLLTVIMFTIIFSNIAKIPTDGVPPMLFYMAGTVIWTYFAECLTPISNTFINSANIFGKVYFPRLVVPISIVISSMIKFFIQFVLFLGLLVYFYFQDASININTGLVFIPFLLIQTGLLGLACGILISAMTTKYRDLARLVAFGVQLWMYATPIVYPVSQVPTKWLTLYYLNPMVAIVEIFKCAFFGTNYPSFLHIGISILITLFLLFIGIVMFSRVEKKFMDTV